ncbi:MAG TPA: DUF3857 domain-containing protein [Chitinophagales bacterium]|nr:DUF3857 domain-containing protein [Chitinophagales bacterium]
MRKLCSFLIVFFICKCSCFSQVGEDEQYEHFDYTWQLAPTVPIIPGQFAQTDAVIIKDYETIEIKFGKGMQTAKPNTFNLIHKIIYINTDAGIELFNTVSVPLDKKSKLVSIVARTISPEGKVTMLNLSNIKEVDNHDGTMEKIFALEGLQKKGTLEYIVKSYEKYEKSYTFYMQHRVPILFKEIEVIAPEYIHYNSKNYNGDVRTFKTTREGIEKKTVYKNFHYYKTLDVPGLPFEDYCNYKAHLTRLEIQFAFNYRYYRNDVRDRGSNQSAIHRFMTYNDLAESLYRQFYEVNEKDQAIIDKAISETVDRLELKQLTLNEQIVKIENYIKSNISVSDELEYEAFSPETILKNKIAGFDNLIHLYLAFFKKMNITCQLNLSCNKKDKAFDQKFDSYTYTEVPLLYFPQVNGYLDPLNLILRYPLCSSNYVNNGVYGINLTTSKTHPFSDYYYLDDIIDPDSIQHIEKMNAVLNFSPEMDSIYMHISRVEPDYFAEDMRETLAFAPSAEKEDGVRDLLIESMKDASVDKLVITNGELAQAEKPLLIEADLSGSALIEKSGNDILLKIGEVIGTQKNLYQENTRTNPIDLDFKHKLIRKIELNIPAGYKISGLEPLNKSTSFTHQEKDACGFRSSYKLEGNKLIIDIEEYYLQTSLPVKVYADFRNVINAAADFNKIAVVLSK